MYEVWRKMFGNSKTSQVKQLAKYNNSGFDQAEVNKKQNIKT